MIFDLHVHTVFSDGKNTPEETVLAAIGKGMEVIGFSDHSYTPCDLSYCMKKEDAARYKAEIRRLKEKYAGQITVLLGLEQDYDTPGRVCGYDYKIGSVHYLTPENAVVPVDESADILRAAADTYYAGDIYALAEAYFDKVSRVIEKTRADIIGHFDLIRKFNRDGSLFDERNPRYRDAAVNALDRLLETKKPFEINTGAISRGYQDEAYPSPMLLDYLTEKGASFVLSGDSHRTDGLCFLFERYRDLPGVLTEWKK